MMHRALFTPACFRSNPVGSPILPAWIGILTAPFLAVSQEAAPADPEIAAYQRAAATVEADLAKELEALAAQRATIAREQPPLARETATLAAELRDKRRQSDLASQSRDALIHDLNALSNRVRLWRDERNYIDSLLSEHRKSFEAQLPLAEALALADAFAAADAASDAGVEAKLALAEQAVARLADTAGPRVREGEALGPDGVARPGTFVSAGPVSWFVASDGSVAGLVAASRDLHPEVVPGTASPDEIRSLAAGESARPAFDPTLGTALALDEANPSLLEHFRAGGLWMWPILIIATVATLAAIAKWSHLARIRDLRPGVVREVLAGVNAGDREKAGLVLAEVKHPARTLLERGIEVGGRVPRDEVEEALYEKFLEILPPLQRGLPLVAIASATAPLLGLLGTVTGMIHTFELINIFGTGDARSLASGISEALITTEFGLVVAIPALILHALLSRKVQGIRSTMELTSLAFVNGLKEPAGAATPATANHA